MNLPQNGPADVGGPIPFSPRRLRLLLTAIVLVAATVRVAYIIHYETYMNLGGAEMERAAVSLIENGYLGDVYGDGTGPSAHVTPVYPFFVSLIYRVFGSHTPAGRLVLQMLATMATCTGFALLPLLSRRLRLGLGPGAVAAFGLALSPVNLWVETSGGWEQPYAVLALFGLLMIFLRLHDRQWRSTGAVIGGGALLGVTALLSATTVSGVALMGLAELAAQRGRRLRVARGLVLMAAITLMVVSPWLVRNYRTFGGFVPLRSNMGLELFLGNHAGANGTAFGTSWEDPNSFHAQNHPFRNEGERARLKEMGERAYMSEKLDLARATIQDHPGRFARLTLKRIRLFWFSSPELWTPSDPLRRMKALAFGLVGGTGLVGLLGLIATRHRYRWILVGLLFGGSAAYMVTYMDPRYRYATFSLTALIGVWALFALLSRLRRPPPGVTPGDQHP